MIKATKTAVTQSLRFCASFLSLLVAYLDKNPKAGVDFTHNGFVLLHPGSAFVSRGQRLNLDGRRVPVWLQQ